MLNFEPSKIKLFLALNTYIIFVIDPDRDEVYPILNWANGSFQLDGEDFPISTVGLFAIFIFVFATIFHLAFYGLTRVKFCILKRAQKPLPESSNPYGSHDRTGHVISGHVDTAKVEPSVITETSSIEKHSSF